MIFFKKNNSIFIISPKFFGNAEAIYYKFINKNSKVLYIAITFREYKRLKSKKINVFFYLNPFHVAKLFKSHSILSTHDIYFISLLKILSTAKLVNIRHGVITLGSNSNFKTITDFVKRSKNYDRYCFLSNKELKIVQQQLSYNFLNHYIFEFPHIEYVRNLNNHKQELKKQMNLDSNKTYILMANTDIRNNTEAKMSLFSIHNFEYLKFLNDLVENQNTKIILKPHWKTKFSGSELEKLKSFKNIIYNIDLLENFDSELKAISDILITDWSTVYVDVLRNIKEIIFLDNIYPESKVIVNELIDNEFINRIKSYSELENKILNSLSLNDQSNTVLSLKSLLLDEQEKDYDDLIKL